MIKIIRFYKNDSNVKHLTKKDLTKSGKRSLNNAFANRVKLKKLRKSDFHKDYYTG